MIYDVLPFMLCTFFKGLFLNPCTFFKGLFALFCHFSKGLSVAKIQNFLSLRLLPRCRASLQEIITALNEMGVARIKIEKL